MNLKDKKVVVTGGSRGLGLGLVEALVARGARVTVVARDGDALTAVHNRLDVGVISADVTEETEAYRILSEVNPEVVVLNAGAKPPMGRLDQLNWADFSATWETDVKSRPLLVAGGVEDAAQDPAAGCSSDRAARLKTDRRFRAAMPAPSGCCG